MESSNESEHFKDMYSQYMNTEAYLYNNPALVSSEILKAVIEDDLAKLINLVESGESLNVSDYFGNGPLHISILKNNSEIVNYLLMKTNILDDRNFLGETPLLKSIGCRKYDLAKKLVHAGADVNIPNKSRVTALHYAITVPKVAHFLIKHGADVDATNLINQTPLHLAVERGYLESVHMLLYYNADANHHDWKGYTPFMRAVETRHILMQEALIEYVADFNDAKEDGWSILGLALREESPFAEEIIRRGADVNNVSFQKSAFFLALHYPSIMNREINLNVIKLIWDNSNFKFSNRRSIFGDLFLVQNSHFQQVLDIIIESDNFSQAAESVCYSDDMNLFTSKCAKVKLPLEKFTEIFCMLLMHGYTPNNYDMSSIFDYYGYCELYRILLYMDIRIKNVSWLDIPHTIPTRLMYDVNVSMYMLLEDLFYNLNDDSLALVIVRLLDYCIHPKLTNAYLNLNKLDFATIKIKALPKVPSLLELARNATRYHIRNTFGVTNSCQLHTLINNLNISQIYKKILTFETVLYKPTYTVNEFEHFIEMVHKCKVTREILDPLMQSEYINANII